jgi:hypothetical protein
VWHDGCLFFNTTEGNLSVRNIDHDPRASAVVDDGDAYANLRGVVLSGRLERAGDDPRLPAVTRLIGEKYHGGKEPPFRRWRNRVWLRLTPEREASWDFRRIPEARARRDAARSAEASR